MYGWQADGKHLTRMLSYCLKLSVVFKGIQLFCPNRSLYGLHLNTILMPVTNLRYFVHNLAASFAPSPILGAEHGKRFKTLSEEFPFSLQESGYMHIQAIKPDTVGE